MRFPLNLGVPIRPPVFIANGDSEDEAADDGNPFTTRRSYWKGTVWLLISLAGQTAASLMSEEVESFYSKYIFYYTTRGLSAVNKFVQNISMGDGHPGSGLSGVLGIELPADAAGGDSGLRPRTDARRGT